MAEEDGEEEEDVDDEPRTFKLRLELSEELALPLPPGAPCGSYWRDIMSRTRDILLPDCCALWVR